MHLWLKWYVCISVDYYSANSANYCDAGKGDCQCSLTNGKCTASEVCSNDGACEGKHKEMMKIHMIIIPSNIKIVWILDFFLCFMW